MTPKNIAFLGGAFNPPTIGHLQVAQSVLNSGHFDEVWLVPSYHHPFSKDMVDEHRRVEMCRMLIDGVPNLNVFTYEIDHMMSGETFKLINQLRDEGFPHNFSFIIGMDNALQFDKWYNSELLKELVSFVVVDRKGYNEPSEEAWFMRAPHMVVHCDVPEVSSTLCRQLIQDGSIEDLKQYLPLNIIHYILHNNLYK